MLHPAALNAFAARQKTLIVATYNQGWLRGVENYQPADRPYDPDAESNRDRDEASLTGAALLASRRLRQYVAPTAADAYRRAIAVAPALNGVNHMVAQLSTLSPTAEQIAAASSPIDAMNAAVAQWAGDNSWRLTGGESAAWAGEQAGFAEAADTGGDLLEWDNEGDDKVCESCDALGSMDPMPLSEWPTTPGAGDTDCNVGCRCSFDVAATMPSTDAYQSYPFTDAQQSAVDQILNTRAQALTGLMPDAALLS
jgi:hypothetical protein